MSNINTNENTINLIDKALELEDVNSFYQDFKSKKNPLAKNGLTAKEEQTLFNYDNLGERTDLDWRVYGKFTQRFQNNQEGEDRKAISNAYYTLMVDYSKTTASTFDNTHGDNYFNYGHVGRFDIIKEDGGFSNSI